MTDYAAELAALPKMPRPDEFAKLGWVGYLDALTLAWEARLAECERLLRLITDDGPRVDPMAYIMGDARAYLAFRAKEQP